MTNDNRDSRHDDAIAIIGMACRLPGAANVDEFWNNLTNGVESLSTFTDEELLEAGVSPELLRSPNYVRSRGIIDGADRFDAAFFGFAPREAELLDPQQRIFLECAWHALEDGGYPPTKTDARIAVYGGVGTNWHLGDVSSSPDVNKFSSDASIVTSNDKDYVTTRVSYKLNLTGPSVNVQCACSTSLVATLMGVSSLLSFRCDLALAGGCTVQIPEKKGYLYQEGGMESPDGHCRPFDAKAKGTLFSRGGAVVLLKRLPDAVRDGDEIYAIILDGAVNNDGSAKIGFTAPAVSGQVEAGIEALERAGVSAKTLTFVEAHGTGTSLGDPIEVASLCRVFQHYTDRKQFCALGSVKGNIGHTDVAAGVTSMIKAALALKHRKLPASLNFESPNPSIDFPNSPFFVNTTLTNLSSKDTPLRAMVNAFGVGGTNASIVIEEPPRAEADTTSRRHRNVVLLSAKTESALDTMTDALGRHIENHPELSLDDIAYTTQVGRADFEHRRFVVTGSRNELLDRLASRATGGLNQTIATAEDRPVAFAFPGQGNQHIGMGHDLYQNEPVFRDVVDAACDLLRPMLDLDLREIMYATGGAEDHAAGYLNETYITQPAIFVTSYAQAKLLMSWGIQPQALIGHSVGEYVAASLAGVFTVEDALTAVARRGQLIHALPRGSMLAVLMSEEGVLSYLTPSLSIAAVNGPELTVIAGPTRDVADLEERLSAEKVFTRKLDTSHAFHSSMMDPALPEFSHVLSDLRLGPPAIPIASTVTGDWMTASEATDPDYWVQHVRRPVRFSDAVSTLLGGEQSYALVECGPGHSLASATKHAATYGVTNTVIGTMRAETDTGTDSEHATGALGALWAAGCTVTWPALYRGSQPRRVSLPGYPFERQRFAVNFSKKPVVSAQKDDQKKPDVGEWFYLPSWKRTPGPQFLKTRRSDDDGCWLLFADDGALTREVRAQLETAGNEVVTIERGETYRQVDPGRFLVRAGAREDYEELIDALTAGERRPSRVVHLWNLAIDDLPLTLDNIAEREELSFYSPLLIEQACVKSGKASDLLLLVAVKGAVDVAGEGVRHPSGALAMGPCRVLAKELTKARGRFVDIDQPTDQPGISSLAANLISEVLHYTDQTVVAYRRGYRWVEAFEPVYLEGPHGLDSQLLANGTYLITGGLGGLGMFLAKQIATSIKSTLVLTYRSSLPERSDWDPWLEQHSTDDLTSERIKNLLELEAAGATVIPMQADCADLDAMRDVVDEIERSVGRIHGVIHAAGMAGGGIITLKTSEMAAEVLHAKVRGTLVLDQLFADRNLDFLLLFSSITSILGEAGRVDYCAANCFMDALAQQRNADGGPPILSVNWPSWARFGMAARWEEAKAHRSSAPPKAVIGEDGRRLQLVGTEGGEEVHDVLFDSDIDWVINSHFVFGVPTLVGTTFLDLVHQFGAAKWPERTTVLENAYFMSPLMFEPGTERRVRLFAREADGKYRISFRSQQVHPSVGPWQEHFRGEVHMAEPLEEKRSDIATLKNRFNGDVIYDPFYRVAEGDGTPFLELGERWESLQAVHLGDNEWLAKAELPEHFRSDLHAYAYHPALLDVALATAVKHATAGAYLPTGYKRVHLKAPITSTIWSHIRLHGNRDPKGEAISFDVTISDPEGRELMTVERYVLRKVAPTASSDRKSTNGAPQTEADGDASSDDILPDEGIDALCRILNAPFIPQVVVSTRELNALIEEENEAVTTAGKTKSHDEPNAPAPAYSRPSLSTTYEEPSTAIEEAVAEVWQGILGINRIGVNDDFTELGGNSLLAVQAVANTAEALNVDLPIETFFTSPTIRGVSDAVVEILVSMASEETLEELLSAVEE